MQRVMVDEILQAEFAKANSALVRAGDAFHQMIDKHCSFN
jgi:hypothetical protein